MLFCFPLNCNRVPLTKTNQSCWKHHIKPAENTVECASMLQAIKIYVYMTKTPVNMHGLMIELWSLWYFYWVCCSWALSTDIKSYCTFACSLRYSYVVSMTTRCSGWGQWAVSHPQVIGGTERSWGLSCDDGLLPSDTGHRTSGKYSDRAWIISLRSESDAFFCLCYKQETQL